MLIKGHYVKFLSHKVNNFTGNAISVKSVVQDPGYLSLYE